MTTAPVNDDAANNLSNIGCRTVTVSGMSDAPVITVGSA
jgi:hypothetical protein